MKLFFKKTKRLWAFFLAAMLLAAQYEPALAETAMDGGAKEAATGASLSNPVHHCTKQNDGSDYTDWSYVYFGSYPQTEVTDEELTEDIAGADYDVSGDAWVNGTKYRRIGPGDTNNGLNFGSSIHYYRYFKWERIKWRVLKNDGETLFVVADQGLDCKAYNENNVHVTWENCDLRQWLKNDFYETAFNGSEQGAIVPQTVVNGNNPEYGTEGGNDTIDKVYLLSIGEAENLDYGFCDIGIGSASRRMQPSDYAYKRGVHTYADNGASNHESNEGNCLWWLRSPGYDTQWFYAARVNDGGQRRSDWYVGCT